MAKAGRVQATPSHRPREEGRSIPFQPVVPTDGNTGPGRAPHHKRESIDAHLTVVFAALAVSRWIEDRTGWSIHKFVRTARRFRTIQIQAGGHTLTAADPPPDDLREALANIHGSNAGAH
jgi:hypothetical protein